MQQFTADAAHELRTPLAAIRATVEATISSKHTDDFAATAATALESIEGPATAAVAAQSPDSHWSKVRNVTCHLYG